MQTFTCVAIALLALTGLSIAAKPCAAKWAQYLDGRVVAIVSLKRGGILCDGEKALVQEQTMKFSMLCAGEEHQLNVPLQYAVDEGRVTVKPEPPALVVVTMHKVELHHWWSSLAKNPANFKRLLEPAVGRGDSEPDPDELEEMAAAALQAASVDASGKATNLPNKREKAAAAAAAKKEADLQQAREDWSDAFEEAKAELAQHGRTVSPQLISRLKTLRMVLKSEEGQISQILGSLLIKRGDVSDGQTMLRRAIELCKKGEQCLGAHQSLAQTLSGQLSDPAVLEEAIKLYRKGAKLLPADYETYYQLGKHINMQDKDKVGGKADKAAAAFRVASSLAPAKAEPLQMLALRLAKAPGRKSRIAAAKIAARAVKLEPQSAMGYVALGNALAAREMDVSRLKTATRDKAVSKLRMALAMSERYQTDQSSERVALSVERQADTTFVIGHLLSVDDANEALKHFRKAARTDPSDKRYGEAAQMLVKGANEYHKEQRQKAVNAEKEALKQLEEEEDAAWEEDGVEF